MRKDIVTIRLYNRLTFEKQLTQTEITDIGEYTLEALKYPSSTKQFLAGTEQQLLPTQMACAFFVCTHAIFRDALKTMSQLLCALEYCALQHCTKAGGDRLSQEDRLVFQILYQESLDNLQRSESIKELKRSAQCKQILFFYALHLFITCDYPSPDIEAQSEFFWPRETEEEEHHFVAFHKVLVGQA